MVAEDLTAKEQEVLRLLATRLSRREIGQRLYVSLNTVKTHQRALYRKLGVENRAEAVARSGRGARSVSDHQRDLKAAYGTDRNTQRPCWGR